MAVACLAGCVGGEEVVESISSPVVGGQAATTCMWPSCVFGRGCSASLVHPRLTVTAAHCVQDGQMDGVANFGEQAPFARTVQRQLCRRPPQYTMASQTGPYDIAFCLLKEAVEGVPIVPVLSACEAEQVIKAGQPVVIAGFGAPNNGKKYTGKMTITQLRNKAEVLLRGDGMTAGGGDSGGPGYVKMPDGTWRVFGAASRAGGDTAIYTLISAHIAWIEKESGVDITPCHDETGAWQGGPGCGPVLTAPDGTGNGTWAELCQGGPSAMPASSCGPGRPSDGGAMPSRPDARAADTATAAADAAPDRAPDLSADDPRPLVPDTAPVSADARPAIDEGESTPQGMGKAPARVSGAGCGCTLGARPASGGIIFVAAMLVLATMRRRRSR
ncbi:MAG TPA: trypsin-like serine protease [Polyangia bacterium]|nr:trypsin-like serine protease [Polyangia bacterium]